MNLAALGGALQGFNSKFDPAAIMQQAQQKQAQAALIASLLQNGGTTGGAPPVPGAQPAGPPMGATPPPIPQGASPAGGPMPPSAGPVGPPQGGAPPAALPGGGALPMPQGPSPAQTGPAPGGLPPTPAAAGGGQLSGIAAGTQDPVTAMRQTLKTMAQQIAAANPKMKGSQLFGAMQEELSLMKGVEPAVKDAMTQYIEAQKLNAKYAGLAQAFQVGMAKVQGAKSIAEMQAATKQMIEDAHERFGIEIQGMKDETAVEVGAGHDKAREDSAAAGAAARVDSAGIAAQGGVQRATIAADASKANANTKAGAQTAAAHELALSRVQATALANGASIPVPEAFRNDKDGQTYAGGKVVKRGNKLVPNIIGP